MVSPGDPVGFSPGVGRVPWGGPLGGPLGGSLGGSWGVPWGPPGGPGGGHRDRGHGPKQTRNRHISRRPPGDPSPSALWECALKIWSNNEHPGPRPPKSSLYDPQKCPQSRPPNRPPYRAPGSPGGSPGSPGGGLSWGGSLGSPWGGPWWVPRGPLGVPWGSTGGPRGGRAQRSRPRAQTNEKPQYGRRPAGTRMPPQDSAQDPPGHSPGYPPLRFAVNSGHNPGPRC